MKQIATFLVGIVFFTQVLGSNNGIYKVMAAEGATLVAGNYQLSMTRQGDTYGVEILSGNRTQYSQKKPVMLYVYNSSKEEDEYTAGYSRIKLHESTIEAFGTITTDNGSVFEFEDIYQVEEAGVIVFERNVRVQKAENRDKGFATRFGLTPEDSSTLTDYNMFAPGVWYKQNENTAEKALGSDYTDEYFFIKETRLALPMFSMQKIGSGETLSICHKDCSLYSEQSEMSDSWLIDEGFQFGSIGIKKSPIPTLYYNYPCYEGEQNYYGNDLAGEIRSEGFVKRSHPVQTTGVAHSYSLYIRLNKFDNFGEMARDNWRYFSGKYDHNTVSINQSLLYENGIEALSQYFRDDFVGGGVGLPWSVWTLKEGVRDYHLQSGFVGQQTKVGWILFRDGLKNSDNENIKKGMKIIDFWVNNSMTNAGLPRTDYFCEWNNGYGGWGTDPLFLRTMSDGCEGVLEAYNTGVKYGTIKYEWLEYCKAYGDFLVNNQNSDGSWARSYNEDGSIANGAKYNTSNAIRYMMRLYIMTKEERYKAAAVKAGEWCLINIDQNYQYVGGTPDNANTIDKEAGVMALNAFNSLYDLTGENKWLNAAINAATFSETWVYLYNYNCYPATRWAASDNSYPQWLQVDLQDIYDINRVETMFEFTNAYYQYVIETSIDGEQWEVFADKSNNISIPTNMGYIDSSQTQKARYVRIIIYGVEGGAWASIYEFKVYSDFSDNLSHNKPTIASSQQDEAHSASLVTDGVAVSSGNSPWPECGIIGQSLVATGHSYTDTFMMEAPAEYFRLYLYTEDEHYLEIAKILSNNTCAASDYNGRLGYQNKALIGEGVMANNFSVFYGEECLIWQLAVQLESICTLEDLFGDMSVENLVHIDSLQALKEKNNYGVTDISLIPVSTIQDGKVYCIVNKRSGKLIDVQGASLDDSANIWQYHYMNEDGQKWKAVAVGDGSWEFVNIKSGKAIDVEGFALVEGGNISQYTNNHTSNQQWYVYGLDGYMIIKNKNSGMVIDVVNFDYLDTANITQFSDYQTENQIWKFYEVN